MITVTAFNEESVSVIFTLANVKQVNQLIKQIKEGNRDPELPEKLEKACNLALTSSLLFQSINDDLVKAQERSKNKSKRP